MVMNMFKGLLDGQDYTLTQLIFILRRIILYPLTSYIQNLKHNLQITTFLQVREYSSLEPWGLHLLMGEGKKPLHSDSPQRECLNPQGNSDSVQGREGDSPQTNICKKSQYAVEIVWLLKQLTKGLFYDQIILGGWTQRRSVPSRRQQSIFGPMGCVRSPLALHVRASFAHPQLTKKNRLPFFAFTVTKWPSMNR